MAANNNVRNAMREYLEWGFSIRLSMHHISLACVQFQEKKPNIETGENKFEKCC
jgi:hypothetical protein